jgi:adenosyl cobinamide kinase/adenosyl cobinamide phosphate guanylyltransferase
MGRLTLVVGGVRSGKSRFAERLAAAHPPVTYLATAAPPPAPPGPDPGDDAMSRRVARHRQRRAALSPPWLTVEEPWDVAAAVRTHGAAGCVLVECLTLWVSNLLLGLPGRPALEDDAILAAVNGLAGAGQEVPARVVVVSNEVGLGAIPMDALARRYGDLLGEANQLLAATAAEVYGCMAGIPWRMKPAV